ncbi:hypothetical protein D0N36_08140 [Hymenobacter lapidiphilus]|uniref:hypothetical protein n=1 Tax=Hymenobacter sp. CCM 8763 TaxID=2303334 RepID=UPI000E35174F|nr:hypothetical protein [Hymenobacter sp. CCM 8763]RFP65653.1 hypothetical protein D0N36_08140 [Hymenobacter sp. CCM 8763]
METISEPSIFDNTPARRRDLLPWWIKTFCWIFMIFGVVVLFCLGAGLMGSQAKLAFYGFETNDPLSPIGLLLIAVMSFKGYSAYLLWFEKDTAITIAKLDAIISVCMCIASIVVLNFLQDGSEFSFRLELILLIPYYIKLGRIEDAWKAVVPANNLSLPL